MVAMVYVLIIAVSLTEGIPLAKKQLWKELVVLGLLMVISAALLAVRSAGLQTPAEVLYSLLSPIGKIFFSHE